MATKKYKSPLTRLQEDIDRCNSKNGCDAYCSKSQQALCPKLRRHAERMDACIKQNIPVHLW